MDSGLAAKNSRLQPAITNANILKYMLLFIVFFMTFTFKIPANRLQCQVYADVEKPGGWAWVLIQLWIRIPFRIPKHPIGGPHCGIAHVSEYSQSLDTIPA